GASGANGGKNAAAGARDFFVRRAFQTSCELVAAVASVYKMSVALDQSRSDPEPWCLSHGPRVPLQRRELRARPEPGDRSIPDRERGVRNVADAARALHRRQIHSQPEAIPAQPRWRFARGILAWRA